MKTTVVRVRPLSDTGTQDGELNGCVAPGLRIEERDAIGYRNSLTNVVWDACRSTIREQNNQPSTGAGVPRGQANPSESNISMLITTLNLN
jgi:hypothetical protein